VSIGRARVIRRGSATIEPLAAPKPSGPLPEGRVVPRARVEAEAQARAIVEQARAEAAEIVAASRRRAADIRLRAEAEARADAAAAISARALALRAREARADELALDRSVQLAVLLAERLLGEALKADPDRVVALARQALREVRSVGAVVLVAHPEDAAVLARSLEDLGLSADQASVRGDATRSRGSVRIETEAGALDGELAPQLERLALKIRETLGT
jgi:flagellar biosynthesis/type III secretory pathway protein FliH